MTVVQNIGFGLKLRKVGRQEVKRRVADAAEILGLRDQLDRKPAHLSGGQRQRVAMGRAIVREPSAFLMDEPLSNLDAKLRVQMRAEILRRQQRVDLDDAWLRSRPAFPAYAGKGVVVGVRPESLRPTGGEHEPGRALHAQVELVESLGAQLLVHFSIDARRVIPEEIALDEPSTSGPLANGDLVGRAAGVATADPSAGIVVGDRVTLAVDATRLQVFDPDTGLAIR